MAKQMPNSPLADAAPAEVVLADGKLVSKHSESAEKEKTEKGEKY